MVASSIIILLFIQGEHAEPHKVEDGGSNK